MVEYQQTIRPGVLWAQDGDHADGGTLSCRKYSKEWFQVDHCHFVLEVNGAEMDRSTEASLVGDQQNNQDQGERSQAEPQEEAA